MVALYNLIQQKIRQQKISQKEEQEQMLKEKLTQVESKLDHLLKNKVFSFSWQKPFSLGPAQI